MNEVRFAGPRAALRVSLCHPTAAIARCCASSPPSPSVEPALRGQNAVGKPCRSPAVSGKKALPNAWWCAGIGRSARQQERAEARPLYARSHRATPATAGADAAIAHANSRHRVSAAAAYRIGNPVRQPAAVSRKVSDESMDIALRLCGSPPRVASRR
jgi:hypothetical protein